MHRYIPMLNYYISLHSSTADKLTCRFTDWNRRGLSPINILLLARNECCLLDMHPKVLSE